jgi:Predicted ATPases of PP-loop superfamily
MKFWNELPAGCRFVASFSGGKDSVLALYKAMGDAQALGLIAMFDASGSHSGAHGLTPEFITKQAEAMGLPISFGCAAWGDYEKVFTERLTDFKNRGAQVLLTGDLDLPEVDCWHERVSQNAGLRLCSPLLRMDHTAEAREFVSAGFSAIIVCVNTNMRMRESDLGRTFDDSFIDELIARGIDPSAEAGEFHTAVIDGPLFCAPIRYKVNGIRSKDQYFLLGLDV